MLDLNLDSQIIPSFNLEFYKIHCLRLVPTTLLYDILEGNTETPDYGLMCIDQARHLLLVPWNSNLPMIGIWTKNIKSVRDRTLIMIILRFITNTNITKLIPGNQPILILNFPNGSSSPECYECLYKRNKPEILIMESDIIKFGSVSKTIIKPDSQWITHINDVLGVEDEKENSRLELNNKNIVENVSSKNPDPCDKSIVNITKSDDNQIESQSPEANLCESMIVCERNENSSTSKNKNDLNIESVSNSLQPVKESDEEYLISQPLKNSLEVQTENIPSIKTPSFSPEANIPPYDHGHLMLYIALLQQQIALLSTQLAGGCNQFVHKCQSMNKSSNGIDVQCQTLYSEMVQKNHKKCQSINKSSNRIDVYCQTLDSEIVQKIHKDEKKFVSIGINTSSKNVNHDSESKLIPAAQTDHVINNSSSNYPKKSDNFELDGSLEYSISGGKIAIDTIDLPPDNGQNYKIFYSHDEKQEFQLEETQNIIASLVSDPEKSFIYPERNVIDSNVKLASNTCVFENLNEGLISGNKLKMTDKTSFEENFKDVLEREELSVSTLEYLKKYGLEVSLE